MEPSPLDGIVTFVAEIVKLGVAACAGKLSSTGPNARIQTKRSKHRLFMAPPLDILSILEVFAKIFSPA
jgi:hypothetical protein